MTRPDEIAALAKFIEAVRSGDFYADYDASTALLRKAMRALDAIRASATLPGDAVRKELNWAVARWHAEVRHRPLKNVHRRSLDDTWRQVIRRLGGDDVALCGPKHDDLINGDAEYKS